MIQTPPSEFTDIIDEAYHAVRAVMDSHGIPIEESHIRNPLISPIRAAMIRNDYDQLRGQGMRSEAVQFMLSDDYCISYGAVHHILFG